MKDHLIAAIEYSLQNSFHSNALFLAEVAASFTASFFPSHLGASGYIRKLTMKKALFILEQCTIEWEN
jgi:hypothetical protein